MRTSGRLVGVYVSIVLAILVLWTMLLPGYILTLDMVFAPHFVLGKDPTALVNNVPLWYLLKGLYLFLPGWLVEKLMLLMLFFLLPYLSYTFLPVPKRFSVRLFASLLYTANTFVYVRMLAGQWTHLYAYALLSLFVHLLFSFTKKVTYKNALLLAAVIALISLFSPQLFVMVLVATFIWIFLSLDQYGLQKSFSAFTDPFMKLFTLAGCILVLTSYWTIPALFQQHSVISVFDASHWQAFAAAGHVTSLGTVPILLNLAALGGFWAEGQSWAQYFAWPQGQVLFWIACACVLALSFLGLFRMARTRLLRREGLFFLMLGLIALIFGAGASATIFAPLNLFLYQHLPLWDGFRDSQKWIALLALSYAVLAGYGVDAVEQKIIVWSSRFGQRSLLVEQYAVAALFLIPIFFGMFVWGGFAKQLKPVVYPQSWYAAKAILDADAATPNDRILVLPWQGYFSLKFNNDLITANPAEQFFGSQVVRSDNVRLDQVYDQSVPGQDSVYSAIDYAVRHNSPRNGETMQGFLLGQHIGYVLYFQDIRSTDTFTYQFLQSPSFVPVYVSPEVEVFQIVNE